MDMQFTTTSHNAILILKNRMPSSEVQYHHDINDK